MEFAFTAEEDASSPYIQSAVVATSLVLSAGSRTQQEHLLPAMARGESIGTLALTEASADFVPEALTLQGHVGGRLNGSKRFVTDVHVADFLLVVLGGTQGAPDHGRHRLL